MGRVPLRSVTHAQVAAWVASLLEAGLSPASVRYAYRVFSRSLGDAVRDKRIASNPAEGLKLPRSAPKAR